MGASNLPDWTNVEPAGGERHLPAYLLLDTSESMAGAPIEAVKRGLEQFQTEINKDEYARSTVNVGVITFGSKAELVGGALVPVANFQPPTLEAVGYTRLDLAFQELLTSMDRDVVKPKKGGAKGDWKPVVFVATDGLPTDANGVLTNALWKPAREAVLKRPQGAVKPSLIVSVGSGPNVVDEVLKEISTGLAVRMSDAFSFVSLFKWISISMSASVGGGGNPDNALAAQLQANLPADLIRIP